MGNSNTETRLRRFEVARRTLHKRLDALERAEQELRRALYALERHDELPDDVPASDDYDNFDFNVFIEGQRC